MDRAIEVARVWRSGSGRLVAIGLALLLVVAGLLGSVYSHDIADAWPLSLIPQTAHAAAFWIAFGATAAVLSWRQLSVTRTRQVAEERLLEKADQLAHLIRTAPPAAMLGDYAALHEQAFAICLAADDAAHDEAVDALVRRILRCVAQLAWKFDHSPKDEVYGANVMLFVPAAQFPEGLEARMHFDAPGAHLLDGALDIQLHWSTTHNSPTAERDGSLIPFALAVPREHRTKGPLERWRVLPGAPYAYVTDDVSAFPNVMAIGEWCEKNGDFTKQTRDEIGVYLAARREGSFVSIPFVTEDGRAILNVHRQGHGILMSTDHQTIAQFSLLIRPFSLMLKSLIEIRRKRSATS